MTRLEDELRVALWATAEQLPPGPPPPPLTLPERRLTRPERRRQRLLAGRPHRARWPLGPGWRRWIVALAAVVLIGALVSGLQALTPPMRSGPVVPPPATGPAGVPAYYVALSSPDGNSPDTAAPATTDVGDTVATIRATGSGRTLAAITVPPPYRAFTQVVAAADDRTFVLVAQADKSAQGNGLPSSRFYLLHFDPALPANEQLQVQALPASYVPAGDAVLGLALSPDGTSLAAIIGDLVHSKLYVYHLRTGGQHVWNWFDCDSCGAGTAVSGVAGPYPRVLSWGADGQTLLFVYLDGGLSRGQVRLLNTDAPGANLFTDSKALGLALGGSGRNWLDAALTPDGRAVIAVREITTGSGQPGRQQLVLFSTATGQPTATYDPTLVGPDYEQIQWTNASGSELILTAAQPTRGAEILKDGRAAKLPWSSRIFDAAW